MWFPTMRHFDKCRLRRACDASFKLRNWNFKWCSVRSVTLIEYSSDQQRLWLDRAYAQADLSFCWSHIPHSWKSHVAAQLCCGLPKEPYQSFEHPKYMFKWIGKKNNYNFTLKLALYNVLITTNHKSFTFDFCFCEIFLANWLTWWLCIVL